MKYIMDLFNNLKISQEYSKYKKHNSKLKLPNLKISIMKERDEIGTFAYTNNQEMYEAISKNEPIMLYYHRDLFTYLPEYTKAILLHEFTHIADFLKFKNYKNTSMVMSTYSEYHSTQVEFMTLCGLNKITTKCKKPLTKVICYKEERITIKEYIEILLAQVLAILDENLNELDDNMKAANAAALIKHLMYFFGVISFYFDSQRDMLIKYFSVFDKFGGYTDMFIKLYGDVMNMSFEKDFDNFVEQINKITHKYLGIY